MNVTPIHHIVNDKIESIYKKIVFNRTIFEGVKPSIEGIDRLENYFYMKEILDNNVSRFIRVARSNDALANSELDIIDISEDVIEDILVNYWQYSGQAHCTRRNLKKGNLMLERLIRHIARTHESIQSSIDTVSYDFDKIENKIGNWEATYLLDSLKDLQERLRVLNDAYDDMVREIDKLNEDLREINYDVDQVNEKIPNDFNLF